MILCASILVQCYKGVGRWEERRGEEGRGQSSPGEDTRSQVAHRRCASILAQRYKGGGWVGVGREEAKAPQVKTQGPELPTDCPDHTTRLKGHHSSQGYNSRLIMPN